MEASAEQYQLKTTVSREPDQAESEPGRELYCKKNKAANVVEKVGNFKQNVTKKNKRADGPQ